MISADEAFQLLRKWQTEKSAMRFLFACSFGGGAFPGIVTEVTGSTVQLIGQDGKSEFLLSLVGAKFEYGDAREAPPELRDKTNQYVGWLTVLFPTGDRASFFELAELATRI